MKFVRPLIALLTLAGSTLFFGCTSKTNEDSSIPWNRPANWEGGIPGMGSPDQDGPH